MTVKRNDKQADAWADFSNWIIYVTVKQAERTTDWNMILVTE